MIYAAINQEDVHVGNGDIACNQRDMFLQHITLLLFLSRCMHVHAIINIT